LAIFLASNGISLINALLFFLARPLVNGGVLLIIGLKGRVIVRKKDFNQLLVSHNLGRKFPMIETNLKSKSSELKLFIFHLALPMLMHILPDEYWYLLFIYTYSIRILHEPFAKSSLSQIHSIIKFYHNSLNEYFGSVAYDYSIHTHLHLVNQVIEHGPLYCHS
jgi:hypothetical protein